MKVAKTMLVVFAAALLATAFAVSARADTEFNKRTVVTFKQPVEIPGQVLPAGTYTIELMESWADRHIVRIFNANRSKLITTVLAIPNRRLTPTDDNVMTFAERPGNAPAPYALKAWFYPGDNFGQEFVYPKRRAMELAQVTQEPIPAVENIPATVEEMKAEPIVAETPQQTEVAIAEAFPITPRATEPLLTAGLPKTASPVPMFAVFGVVAVGFGIMLKRLVA